MAYWWVNRTRSLWRDLAPHILWAPQRTPEGRRRSSWDRIVDVQRGDTVLHYGAGKRVVGLNEVVAAAIGAPRPTELPDLLGDEGWVVRTTYRAAVSPVLLEEIPAGWRTGHSRQGPFESDGSVKGGIVFPLDDDFAARFLERFGDRFLPSPVALPAEARDEAVDMLRRLIGVQLRTVQGRPNRILGVQPPNVVVATGRSPDGKPVPIQEVQDALDLLRRDGKVTVNPETIGHRSAFIGAVLRTLPGAVVEGSPPVLSFVSLAASDNGGTDANAITYEGDLSHFREGEQRCEQAVLRQ
jgi:hypothetical protein